MNYLDLMAVLYARNGKGLERSHVYGLVTRELPKPGNIFPSVKLSPTGRFVEIDVFAVNLDYTASFLRSYGVKNKDSIFMVNGSMVAYIDSDIKFGNWYDMFGTVRLGSKDATNQYVGILSYYKSGNDWKISPCRVEKMDASIFAGDTEMYDCIMRSISQGEVGRIRKVQSLQKFQSTQRVYTDVVFPEQEKPVEVQMETTFKQQSKVSRQTCAEFNSYFEIFEGILESAESARALFIKSIVSDYSEPDLEPVHYLCDNLVTFLSSKPDPHADTGRGILKKYLSHFKGTADKYIGKKTIAEYLYEIFDEIAVYIFDHDRQVTCDAKCWDVCKTAFGNIELFYCGVLADILGLDFDKMLDFVWTCLNADVSPIAVVARNPYLMSVMSDYSFAEIDKIAIAMGMHMNGNLDDFKNMAILDDYINSSESSSTLFTMDMLKSAGIGLSLTKSQYEKMTTFCTYFPNNVAFNITSYVRSCAIEDLGYTSAGFVDRGYRKVRVFSNDMLVDVCKSYSNVGLGMRYKQFVTSYRLLKKELFIAKTMHTMAEQRFDYSHADIDKYISEYEEKVGFILEPEQRDAVHLVVNGAFIVTGSAGSGKTTVSNCIVYVLEHLDPNLSFSFCAPTGKAAKRMQEVVKRPCKTMHSQFKLGVSNSKETIFVKDEKNEEAQTVFFFDEGAMISLDLMYRVLLKIDPTQCRVFLFGDVAQLSPIGKGTPFKNLLRFMPCEYLRVSKRAADGSSITRMSYYINEFSSRANWRELESDDEFTIIQCKTGDIWLNIVKLCDDLIHSGVNKDDIQVVTPLRRRPYTWGTESLNEKLEPLFNMTRGYSTRYSFLGSTFAVGDRVIHTDRNMYNMQWYIEEPDGAFRKTYGYGICNGEVGRITGIHRALDVTILQEFEDVPSDFEYPESLRDDTTWIDGGNYFISVAYYDYIGEREITILYRATENSYEESNTGICLKGEDLSKLILFYAGTTHKLQGSEARYVICAVGDLNYTGFLTREMLYTMVTRGRDRVYLVGSLNMVSKARRDISSANTLTVGEVIA